MENHYLNILSMRIAKNAASMDPIKAKKTFAALGDIVSYLEIPEHQVIFGRRGSGKTHALRFLAEQVRESQDIPVYMDMRQIGSSGGMYGDPRVPLPERATQLLMDIVQQVHESLFSIATEPDDDTYSGIVPVLDRLAEAAGEVQVIGDMEIESTDVSKSTAERGVEINLSLAPPKVAWKDVDGNTESVERGSRSIVRGRQRPHLVFGALAYAWRQLSQELGAMRVWLLLDEWTTLPIDVQPLLADLLRRAFLPLNNVVVKIGAVERTARFEERYADGDYTGIELGADITTTISIDEYLSAGADQDSARTEMFLREMLYKHLLALVEEYGYTDLKYENPAALGNMLFADASTWREFTKAGEGIPRHALAVLSEAARHSGANPITKRRVRMAARYHFVTNRRARIAKNRATLEVLTGILGEVIGKRHSRTFALRHDTDSLDPRIRELYEHGLLHIARSGVGHVSHPGELFDVFLIDYGCYVDSVAGDHFSLLEDPTVDLREDARDLDHFNVNEFIYRLPKVAERKKRKGRL
jgi:hypothetical protein